MIIKTWGEKMFLDKAIQRINDIQWDRVGHNPSSTDAQLGYEFLRRLAHFFKEQSIKPTPPLYANIARLLGDSNEEVIVADYCTLEASGFLSDNLYVGKIFGYYIQLAKYADQSPDTMKYLHVYEPLIKIIEKGGLFILKHLELDIVNVANFPLHGWYNRFVDKEAINVDEM